MRFLKGLGNFILSFLLFISLTAFGVAFLLHGTVLNPDFVTGQVDKVKVSVLIRDVAEEQISGRLPAEAEFLKDAVYRVIDDHEPWLKEQLDGAIRTGYDFFLGKTDRLEITVSLVELKRGLKDSLWQTLTAQLGTWLPEFQNDLTAYIDQHLTEYAAVVKPYLPPAVAGLPVTQLRPYLDQYLQQIESQITGRGVTPEVSGLLEALIKPYFDEYYNEFAAQVPDEVSADQDTIPPDTMSQMLLARKYIGYFQTGYYLLIAFMLVLAAGIFLINRNVKDTTRALGIDLIVYAALDLAGIIFARRLAPLTLVPGIPASLDSFVTGLFNDVLTVMQTFSIVVLAIGIILLAISFVPRQKAAEA